MKKVIILFVLIVIISVDALIAQTLTEKQMQNARATGYSIVASRNPGIKFSIYIIPWDGSNSLETNANQQINSGWHAQAAIKGNYFYQEFNGSDFTQYSSVVLSQEDFDLYKDKGTQWWIVCSTLPPFSENISFKGNVGIGTSNPGNFKLAVEGIVGAREVKVTTDSWSDFVFKPNYNLRPLSEVEQFIKANNHLPEIPSEAEVKENGIGLGEMNAKLLQKVEELTLYLIEQQKTINSQMQRIKELEIQNKNIVEIQNQLLEFKNLHK